MKLKIYILVLACVLSGMVLTGCNDNGGAPKDTGTNPPATTNK